MWKYEKCILFMSTNKTSACISLDPKNTSSDLFGYAMLQRKIQKGFKDKKKRGVIKYYYGTITSFDGELYSVEYEDGDLEQLDATEVVKYLKPN